MENIILLIGGLALLPITIGGWFLVKRFYR